MTVEIPHNIGDTVKVRDMEDTKMIVVAITIDSCGLQYKVAYWADGSRRDAWVFASEVL